MWAVTPDYAKGSVAVQGQISPEGTEIGLVYGTAPQPTIANQQAAVEKSNANATLVSATVGSLQLKQRYYFRLYAKKDGTVLYSNERTVLLSPDWKRLPDLAYEGQPLPYGWINDSFGSFQLTVFTRTNFVSESSGQQWNYYSSDFQGSQWRASSTNSLLYPARYNPIYLPYTNQITYFFGGGYYYIPEPIPTYNYQKFFDDYRDGPAYDYPGDDLPTVQFAIGASLPDLYVLEIGKQYRLWKYQNRITPTGWELVEGAEFPRKNLTKLFPFAVNEKGYLLSEDDNSLWAFDPTSNRWQERKKTPFANREKGAVITISKGAVYGLGYNTQTGEGYRDLWLYDDQNDAWSYLTDYPGEGSANVTAVGRNNRVGFLFGHRATATPIGTAEFSAAKDVWLYEPK
ncbi:MAG: hypothetical protein U0X91_07830 [Spirosomataceae bacterium]